jgi:hypothetical protein
LGLYLSQSASANRTTPRGRSGPQRSAPAEHVQRASPRCVRSSITLALLAFIELHVRQRAPPPTAASGPACPLLSHCSSIFPAATRKMLMPVNRKVLPRAGMPSKVPLAFPQRSNARRPGLLRRTCLPSRHGDPGRRRFTSTLSTSIPANQELARAWLHGRR